jgi:hypothetical protein
MTDQTAPLDDPSAMDPPVDRSLDAPMAAPETRSRLAVPAFRLPSASFGELIADRARLAALVVFVFIILTGGFLRLTHGNWDRAIGENTTSGHLHPDERFLTSISVDTKAPSGIVEYFDTDTSPLNPYNITRPDGSKQTTFVYGTLPLFLNKAVAANTSVPYDVLDTIKLGDPVNATLGFLSFGRIGLPERDFNTYDTYNLSGRWLSAIVDILTIAFVFLLGRQLANRNVGLIAAALYAFTPFAIQNSHFYIVDPYMTLFATMTLYFGVKGAKHGGMHNFVLAGISAGLAIACKTTAIALLPVVILAVGIYAWTGIRPFVAPLWAGDTAELAAERDGRKLDQSVLVLIAGSVLALLGAFVAYRIMMPYAFKPPSIADLFTPKAGSIGPVSYTHLTLPTKA